MPCRYSSSDDVRYFLGPSSRVVHNISSTLVSQVMMHEIFLQEYVHKNTVCVVSKCCLPLSSRGKRARDAFCKLVFIWKWLAVKSQSGTVYLRNFYT